MRTWLLICACCFISCNRDENQITRAFYHWKTNLSFSQEDKQRFSGLHIKKLYTKFFDVDYKNQPEPLAVLTVSSLPDSTEIIPVIYITNRTMESIKENEIDSLAHNLVKLVRGIAKGKISFHELQIDCDWSIGTKGKYFALLGKIKELNSNTLLSCTIRLHQVKYPDKTGVPPVDRGMLMFYNMGDLKDTSRNSIYNEPDAKKYTSYVKGYKLPLDIVLPVFGWTKHYRNHKLVGLINSTDLHAQEPKVIPASANHWVARNDFFIKGQYIQAGDYLVVEEIPKETALDAAKLLGRNTGIYPRTVALYHWDDLNLSKYSDDDIEKIYRVFN